MNFYMNEQRELVRDAVREFVDKEVRPEANTIDRDDVFPEKLFRRAGELGFLDLLVPEEFGGSGTDLTTHCIIIEEISKASATLGMCMIAHSGLAMTVVNILGTPDQKNKWLTKMVTGEAIGAYCMTEPCGNGNDLAYTCKAVEDGDEFVIDGMKCFVTNIEAADIFIVKAVTGGPGVFSYLLVEKGTPGFSVGKIEDKVGWRGSSTGNVNFDSVRVPRENLLGPLDQGVKMSPHTVLHEMTACGSCALGISEEALALTSNYLKDRMHIDGMSFPMKYDVMRIRLMENQAKINAIRSMTYAVAMDYDAKKPNLVNSLLIKASCFKAAEEITSTCMDLEGGVGVVRDAVVERLWRDAKVGLIGGGQYDNLLSMAGTMRIMGIS